jgi:hypothetical protein
MKAKKRYNMIGGNICELNNNIIEKMKNFINKTKNEDVEYAGVILFDLSDIRIMAKGNDNEVLFPSDCTKKGYVFHTHPLNTERSYYFHTPKDIYQAFRFFFNNNQQPHRQYVLNDYGIVCVYLECKKYVTINKDEIPKVIIQIKKFITFNPRIKNYDYEKSFVIVLGEAGYFSDKYKDNQESWKLQEILLKNNDLKEKFNQNMNKGLQKYKYLKNVRIRIDLVATFN